MIDELDFRLLEAVQQGLPIAPRPYAKIAEQLGLSEQALLDRLKFLKEQGLIKRWGVVVKHRQLGYRANAMIVLDVPDQLINDIGGRLSQQSHINLCYQRPRQGLLWPYNLYCMIHGKCRESVLAQWQESLEACNLSGFRYEILFSRRCFKQRGALYALTESPNFEAHYG